MSKHVSVFYQILNIFSSFFLLNLLWLLCCIPVITIFPATAALFGTARTWVLEGMDAGIFKVYGREFKSNFKKSFVIGLLGLGAGLILYMDFSIVFQNEFFGKNLLFIVLLFFTMLVTFTAVYVFFILPNYELSILHTLKNALLLSIAHMNYTVVFLGMILITLIIVYYFPILLFVGFSLLAFCMYGLFHRLSSRGGRSETANESMTVNT